MTYNRAHILALQLLAIGMIAFALMFADVRQVVFAQSYLTESVIDESSSLALTELSRRTARCKE